VGHCLKWATVANNVVGITASFQRHYLRHRAEAWSHVFG
jgi:hypothetical protein